MPIMVLCFNCKYSAGIEPSAEHRVLCDIDEVQATLPRTRCKYYEPLDGTSQIACDCSACSFQRRYFILDESEEAGYIEGVNCGVKKRPVFRHPTMNCPDFFPTATTTQAQSQTAERGDA